MCNQNLYILERPSSWSTSRIRPSWPQFRVRLRSLLLSSMSTLLLCLSPPSILLLTPTAHVSRSNSSLPTRRLHTNVQANNITTLHHIYTVTHTHITFIILLTSFFILLPLSWAGRLSQTFSSVTGHRTSYSLSIVYINKAK